jgi:hypothetical protein
MATTGENVSICVSLVVRAHTQIQTTTPIDGSNYGGAPKVPTHKETLPFCSAPLALLLELLLFPHVVGGGCGRCLSDYGERNN